MKQKTKSCSTFVDERLSDKNIPSYPNVLRLFCLKAFIFLTMLFLALPFSYAVSDTFTAGTEDITQVLDTENIGGAIKTYKRNMTIFPHNAEEISYEKVSTGNYYLDKTITSGSVVTVKMTMKINKSTGLDHSTGDIAEFVLEASTATNSVNLNFMQNGTYFSAFTPSVDTFLEQNLSDNWHNITVTSDGGTAWLWIDCKLRQTSTVLQASDRTTIRIGAPNAPDVGTNVTFQLHHLSYTTTQIINESGTNCSYSVAPPSGPGQPNLTITAKDYFDDASINKFSVRLFDGNIDFTKSTSNGTILINNITENSFYNLTFFSNLSYFNVTYKNINASGQSYVGKMWQSLLYINASEVISGIGINDIWAVAYNQNRTSSILNFSNSTGFVIIKVRSGTYNITVNSTPYFNNTAIGININVLSTNTTTIELGKIRLNINATIVTSGENINNFEIRLNLTNTDYQNYTNNKTTTIKEITYFLINGTYGLNFLSNDYANQFNLLILNDTGFNFLYNYTFQVFTTNSINFTFFDEIIGKNKNFFNGTAVSFNIISEGVYAQNFTTNNATFFIDLLTPSDYRITYSSAKYKARNFYFSLANRSHNILNLYLLSLGNSTDVVITSKDESGNLIQNATLSLLRYYVDSNSYVTVAMERTNEQGEAIFDVDFDDAFYQTLGKYKEFQVLTSGTKIFSTTLTIKIDTLTNPFSGIDAVTRVRSNITFNNETQTFSFFFSDGDGLSRTGTLRIYEGDTIVCENSAEGSSGTVLCQYNTTNSLSIVRAVGYIDGSLIPIVVKEILSGFLREAKDIFGRSGMFYTIIFAGTSAGLGIFHPAAAIIMFLAGLMGMLFMGIGFINMTVYILIMIVGSLVIWRLRS